MKFKLFISLSFLTAFFSMNASTFQVAQLMKHSILAAKESVRPCMKKFGTGLTVGATAGYGLYNVALYAGKQAGLYGEQQQAVDTLDSVYENAKNRALDDVLKARVMPAAILSTCQTKAEFDADVQNTRFGKLKIQLNKGVSFAQTHKTASVVVGTAVVAGLGYMAYNKIAAKYAQAKTPVVTTPVVTSVVSAPVEKAVVKKAVKKSTPSRRNNSNRRK